MNPPSPSEPHLLQPTIVIALVVAWTLWLLLRDRFELPALATFELKFTHLLPTTLQVVLFGYWSLYWSGVIEHLPVLAAQLVVAYLFDFLLGWSVQRRYSPTLGPVPVVLSTNLFVWFPSSHAILYALVIVLGLSSRVLIRSGGRHVFNPSVFGITVVGALCILLPRFFQYRDVSHDFARPPQMTLVILLLALVPQIRLGTAPIAVGAAVTMLVTMLTAFALTGYRGGPSPWWPPWLLAITLLAPDPATTPAAPVSRLLFGLFLGFAYYVVSRALLFAVGTDFFSKILPITMTNLLVPYFERAGARVSTRWPRLNDAGARRVYIAGWLTLSVVMGAPHQRG